MVAIEELIQQCLGLPEDDQVVLVNVLLDALHAVDPGRDAEWAKLAEERAARLDAGDVEPLAHEVVMAEVRAQLRGQATHLSPDVRPSASQPG